jgi:hypothetical protein
MPHVPRPVSLFFLVYRELAERKSQFAQEISAALMQVEDYKKASEEAASRADEAEQYQKMVQVNFIYYLNVINVQLISLLKLPVGASRSQGHPEIQCSTAQVSLLYFRKTLLEINHFELI